MPFIISIIADLSGDVTNPDTRLPYGQREFFVEIDRHTVDEVMKALDASIDLTGIALPPAAGGSAEAPPT